MQSKHKNNPIVSIICLTYNQAAYIKESLEGFLMQNTHYSFEVIVHDDASNDGTTEIVKEYGNRFPEIFHLILQEQNQYSIHGDFSKILKLCINKCKGKYIAFCEGDDFWSSKSKLQNQVDFLEQNPNYTMVYSKVTRCYESESYVKDVWGRPINNNKDLVLSNPISTPTVMIRKEILDNYYQDVDPTHRRWLMSDYPMWLYASFKGEVKFFDAISATYRILKRSASHHQDFDKQINFSINSSEISLYFAENYANDMSLTKKIKNSLNYKRFLKYFVKGENENLYKIGREIILSNVELKKKLLVVMSYIFPKNLLRNYIVKKYIG